MTQLYLTRPQTKRNETVRHASGRNLCPAKISPAGRNDKESPELNFL
jgi:hypothetical protein